MATIPPIIQPPTLPEGLQRAEHLLRPSTSWKGPVRPWHQRSGKATMRATPLVGAHKEGLARNMTADNQNVDEAQRKQHIPSLHTTPGDLSDGSYWFAFYYRVQLQHKKMVCGNRPNCAAGKENNKQATWPKAGQSVTLPRSQVSGRRMSPKSGFFFPMGGGEEEGGRGGEVAFCVFCLKPHRTHPRSLEER